MSPERRRSPGRTAAARAAAIAAIALGAAVLLAACGGDAGTPGVLEGWPGAAREDFADVFPPDALPEFTPVEDPQDDQFSNFGRPALFTSDQAELIAGGAIEIDLDQEFASRFECAAQYERAEVFCLPDISGTPQPGRYVLGILSVEGNISERDIETDYRYNLFLEQPDRAVYPQNIVARWDTLQGTNRFLTVRALGPRQWELLDRWFEVERFHSHADLSEGRRTAPAVRAVVGRHSVAFLLPADVCEPEGCNFNVGTNNHPVGADFTPANTALDVLGANPTEGLYPVLEP